MLTSDTKPRPRGRPAGCRGELLAAVDELPPLPAVLNRVNELLRDSNASASQVAAEIEKDGVLSGSVLNCVNSAHYGLPVTISSIRQAVSLLGFSTVRNLTMAFSLQRMSIHYRKPPPPQLYSRYSQHSLACALLCHLIAPHTDIEETGAAFAVGLFHDIGKLLILTTFPGVEPKIVAEYEAGQGNWEQAEMEALGITHSQVSGMVAEKWHLPASVQEAVHYHHHPGDSPAAREGSAVTLAHIVHAADLYVNEFGLTTVTTARTAMYSADSAFEDIGLRPKMPELVERFKKECEGLRGSL